MRTFRLLLAGVVMTALPVNADVYKWRDAKGRVHFGDKPPTDATTEQVRIRTFQGPAEVSAAPTTVSRVTVLTTSWCGVCRRAKAWLAAKGVAYAELDVEKDATGKEEFRKLGGTGVPIILVGRQRMNGFSPERLEQMLRDADN